MSTSDCPCVFCQLQRLPTKWRAAASDPNAGTECAAELETILSSHADDHVFPIPDSCDCAWCEVHRLPTWWTGYATAWQGLAEPPTYEQCADDLQKQLEIMGIKVRRQPEKDDFGLVADEFKDVPD